MLKYNLQISFSYVDYQEKNLPSRLLLLYLAICFLDKSALLNIDCYVTANKPENIFLIFKNKIC